MDKPIIVDSWGNPITHFTQWENNREIIIKGLKEFTAPPDLHYWDGNHARAIVVPSEILPDMGGIKAKVPNIMLQYDDDIVFTVYDVTEGNQGVAVALLNIPVLTAVKPEDYDYFENIDYVTFTELIKEAEALLLQLNGAKDEIVVISEQALAAAKHAEELAQQFADELAGFLVADDSQTTKDNLWTAKKTADELGKKLDALTVKSEGISEIVSAETLHKYFYDRRKDTSRSWQFEISEGSNENIIAALGGVPEGHAVSEKWFLYITLPYSEAGGFIIHAQLEGHSNGLMYKQEQFSTLNANWHSTGWIPTIQRGREVFTAVITPEVGRLVCDMTASQIIDASRQGVVKAEYEDEASGETREYYYFKQMPDGRAVFAKDGYIENGVPKQTLIYVDFAGMVEVETRTADVVSNLELSEAIAELGKKIPTKVSVLENDAKYEESQTIVVHDPLPDVSDIASLRKYFYDLRKTTQRKWQFEVSEGGTNAYVMEILGYPNGVAVADMGFLYVEIPYSEAGGFEIRFRWQNRNKPGVWDRTDYGTVNSNWKTSGWKELGGGGAGGPAITHVDVLPEPTKEEYDKGRLYLFNNNLQYIVSNSKLSLSGSKIGDFQRAHENFSSAYVGEKVYISGGNIGGSFFDDVYVYDEAKNETATGLKLPVKLARHCSCMIGNTLYCFGGRVDGGVHPAARAFKINVETGESAELAEAPYSFEFAGCSWYDNKVYIFGGADGSGKRRASVVVYDINTNTYESLDNVLPEGISGMGVSTIGEFAYIIGGILNNTHSTAKIVKYNMATNTVHPLGFALPYPLCGIAPIARNKSIFVFGGFEWGPDNTHDEILEISEVSSKVTQIGTIMQPIFGYAVGYSNNSAYTVNGNTHSAILADINKYDFAEDARYEYNTIRTNASESAVEVTA